VGDLFCGDEAAGGLSGSQRFESRLRVGRGGQQPLDPRGVGGAGGNGVYAHPLAYKIGCHCEDERVQGALAGAVRRSLDQTGPGGDGTGAHHSRTPAGG